MCTVSHIVTNCFKPYKLNFSKGKKFGEKNKMMPWKSFVFPCKMFLCNIDKILISVYILSKEFLLIKLMCHSCNYEDDPVVFLY